MTDAAVPMLEPWIFLAGAIIGLTAGVLGGMLGVGGSLIMIPCLVLLFGQGENQPGWAGWREGLNQHLYQAAAMIVNIFVAVAATARHRKKHVLDARVLKATLPAAVAAILAGVWISNLPIFRGSDGPILLGRVMALFMVYVIAVNVHKMLKPPASDQSDPTDNEPAPAPSLSRGLLVGSLAGLTAGLLGIGGGAVAVPLFHVVLRLPLRQSIMHSSAMMCLTALVGAVYKNATLSQHDLAITNSLALALVLAPAALLGGYLGARLVQVLPLQVIRAAFVLLMGVSAWRMSGFAF